MARIIESNKLLSSVKTETTLVVLFTQHTIALNVNRRRSICFVAIRNTREWRNFFLSFSINRKHTRRLETLGTVLGRRRLL